CSSSATAMKQRRWRKFMLSQGARFYFLHSFYFESLYLEHAAAGTFYGHDFNSAVSRDNIFGVQFHPEKSHHFGVKLLKNFAEL
ncbi:glutamine amidotransferase-related protein, partial [Pseudomonas aeruginosa]|uniref:glutamine amidotransferase-related protein n=1 Tax=Pseudomonas aeruginosa TaxID=287 RepID=UPI0031B7737B